jgi:hypothetical protein
MRPLKGRPLQNEQLKLMRAPNVPTGRCSGMVVGRDTSIVYRLAGLVVPHSAEDSSRIDLCGGGAEKPQRLARWAVAGTACRALQKFSLCVLLHLPQGNEVGRGVGQGYFASNAGGCGFDSHLVHSGGQ